MQSVNIPQSGVGQFMGTGGFMVPDQIVRLFGLQEGMHVADFGSGSGYFTILMGKIVGQTGKVTALDIMETSLDSVRVKAKAAGLENVETIRANLEVLGSSGLAGDSQDAVLLANILFQSPKKEAIIKEAVRILKRDGLLIIIDWKKSSGGFGPPDDLRTDHELMKNMATFEGVSYQSDIDAGTFHYGMIFKK